MANEVVGPILGTVVLAGVNGAGEPTRADHTVLVAGLDSDRKAHWLLVDSAGQVLSSGGVSLGSTPSTQAMGDAAAGGSATTASKNDHKHGMPALGTTAADVGTSAGGSAVTPSKSDHVHAVPDQHITSRMVNLTAQAADVATAQTTTSTSYADLTTPGPAITMSPGVVQDHLLLIAAEAFVSSGGAGTAYASVAIAGAAAADLDARWHYNAAVANSASKAGTPTLAAAQANGAVHTMKYRTSANTATFSSRRIIGVAV